MAIDRGAVQRNAEKLLRQGKLDLAIAEYVRLIEDQPHDWNTANVLGDLYARVKQVDKAVEQYVRIADSLHEQGFLQKAGALYKKVLKFDPRHEHALLQSAEVAASQGLLADARGHLNAVGHLRRARSDERGAVQIRIRLGNLDPGDFEARKGAARARVEIRDVAQAVNDFKEIAAAQLEQDDSNGAMETLREAAALRPGDEDIRHQLLDLHLAAGDVARARECATTAEQFRRLASASESAGLEEEALASLTEAARLDPGDNALRTRLARTFLARGDAQAAAEHLSEETAGEDPALRLLVAEMRLRSGDVDAGIAMLERLLHDDERRRDDVARVGWTVAEVSPDAGLRAIGLAVDRAVAARDWPAAAAALQELVTRVPSHVPALLRLVDVCVDGGLEATMHSAQAQLADAYLAAGAAREARFIAEDLVAREPWERANLERFRQALVLSGEADPDGVIADRLSGKSPFVATDMSLASPPPPAEPVPESMPSAQATPATEREKTPSASLPSAFALGAASIDLGSLLAEFEEAAFPTEVKPSVDVDLTGALDLGVEATELSIEANASAGNGPADAIAPVDREPVAPLAPVAPAAAPPVASASVTDSARQGGRDEAGKSGLVQAAEAEYRRGVELRDQGRVEESLRAFEGAARSPRLRFRAAAAAARIHREHGRLTQAIAFYERAAQAPPPTADEGHLLLYELGHALEAAGETARALAVWMELLAVAGDYRDVRDRMGRLSRVQARE